MEKRFSSNPFLYVKKYDKSIPEHFKSIIEQDNRIKPLWKRSKR
jgi:hypothetical protein